MNGEFCNEDPPSSLCSLLTASLTVVLTACLSHPYCGPHCLLTSSLCLYNVVTVESHANEIIIHLQSEIDFHLLSLVPGLFFQVNACANNWLFYTISSI